jgi:ABC-type Mn2+/Zn2+ transport system permease subunit
MSFFDTSIILGIGVSIFVGAAAGYLGSFMVLRRMALVGDALSHVALPGIAIALLHHLNPFLGAFSFLLMAVLAIWAIEEKTSLSTEALVGVFFTSSLALGVLLTPEPELLEALFGDVSNVAMADVVLAVVLSVLMLAIAFRLKRDLLLSIVSRDLAESAKLNIRRSNLIFLLLVAVVVALGVKVVGTLLMGALVILPAVAARNIARSFSNFSLLSVLFGIGSAVIGGLIAAIFSLPPGPIIVLAAASFFFVSLALRKS